MNRQKATYDEQFINFDQFGTDIHAEIEKLFQKTFLYTKPANNEWQLPDPSQVFTSNHEAFSSLEALKDSLNEVKNKLSDKQLDEWHQHTSFTNKAGKVIAHVKKLVNAELCTQAWCKFHEVVCSFPLLPSDALQNGELNSVHLCEAPGAFIASLNHYLKSHRIPCDWNWVANTLNPYHEANDTLMMIMDDRLIANTLPWWYFGPENTGDVTSLNHLTGLQHFISNMATVHLVTSDGSFDCQGNPGEQEMLVSPLHYCETVTALMTLGHGGSFVLKMFTLFEHSSVNLLFLLNCSFEEVHVFKPATSKAGNSEVYVVCLRYLGREAIHFVLSKMLQNFGSELVTKALFPQHLIPESFLKVHEECCLFFHKHQTETISENLRLFDYMDEAEQARLNALRDCCVKYFLQRFQLKPISRNNWLVKKPHAGYSMNSKWFGQRNKYFCTYNERKLLESLSWEDKIVKGCLNQWIDEHVLGNVGKGCVLEGAPGNLDCRLWYTLEGQQLPSVKFSPFCDGEVLKSLNEAIEKSLVGQTINGDLTRTTYAECQFCCVLTASSVLSELSELMEYCEYIPDNNCISQRKKCLVLGFPLFYDEESKSGLEVKNVESASLLTFSCSLLHDGEPKYQLHFLECLLGAFPQLQKGDALVLPVLSCLTRFMAGLVFILQNCFQHVSFACSTSSQPLRTNAVLLCAGYQGLPDSVFQYLQQLNKLMRTLLDSKSPQQVLQFVPMENLLKGLLMEFLWDLNTAIAKRQLHLIVQIEQQNMT
ncbi:cap-specific mRNA (nucleoside-2'-O-)-methyltransferase 2 [Crotalus tigris]|uniref:cap-specific mRNA (nucleoside-2'-O-)-methyltransferase 2 n=1 Tax=Crotalus tigris TaxID=88082 RepID=UPI00192FA11C|nr:cap-specific mRNA (nucleoside-2'-O-)-methyltransferase 2 [Crotalus tigris]XP_039194051.1 cap-specific mRNA (nucleoside-2'-O-)-methyltransferase 2 [Crotalus tigris]XP_039194052.1 cap-specific mRNA (nucleoside-2'-O-)-methyltransferase 2 [Crotalus tigris]XP_039194053.1 cap-specific mRNA (nucleoside-2'-O-)-methyltransferase 2 [Crotalus tigris]